MNTPQRIAKVGNSKVVLRPVILEAQLYACIVSPTALLHRFLAFDVISAVNSSTYTTDGSASRVIGVELAYVAVIWALDEMLDVNLIRAAISDQKSYWEHWVAQR